MIDTNELYRESNAHNYNAYSQQMRHMITNCEPTMQPSLEVVIHRCQPLFPRFS